MLQPFPRRGKTKLSKSHRSRVRKFARYTRDLAREFSLTPTPINALLQKNMEICSSFFSRKIDPLI